MVSRIEKIVREMDDDSKGLVERSREIAEELGIKEGYVKNILCAKRHMYKSMTAQANSRLKERGFNRPIDYYNYQAKRRGHADYLAYQDERVRWHSFLNKDEYNLWLYYHKKGKFESARDFQEREGLLRFVELHPIEFFDRLPSERISPEQSEKLDEINNNISGLLKENIETLSYRERQIMLGRYAEEKTLVELASDFKISNERVRQIEQMALRKLYFLAKESGLDELYASRQDLMK